MVRCTAPRTLRTLPLLSALAIALSGALAPAQSLPNGVAAGDVDKDNAVLWTRSTALGHLVFEWTTDATFGSRVHRRAVDVKDAEAPVKCDVRSLTPGTKYWYRVTDSAGATAQGTFTTPFRKGTFAGLDFGVSGDSRGDLAPFPSVVNAIPRDLDFFADLGDTIYADVVSPILPGLDQATTLAEFRLKHHEVLSAISGLNALADLRASTPFLAVIDDHEVTDDFSGGAPPSSDPRFDLNGAYINETQLYDNGLHAFVDYHPMRDERWGNTGDPRTAKKRKLYRSRRYGSDASIFLLDARSFRDEELVPANPTDLADVIRFLTESFDPTRTMLGAVQLKRLKDDLREAQNAGVTWKFVMVPEPIQNLGVLAAPDRFEGYAAERNDLLAWIADNAIRNVVFVTADIHGTLVNNITFQRFLGAPQEDAGAFEISTGAIAYDAPFGPTVVGLAWLLGLISNAEKAFYDSLPLDGKEDFLRTLVDAQLAAFGLDTLGLDGSSIQATLLQGKWTATHTYGWSQFSIDAATQKLTVTTWGLDPANLGGTPTIWGQFEVDPQ